MKNKFLLVILAIAIFIPSVVAIVNYNAMQTAPADSRTAVSITINDINGNRYYLEKKQDGDEADKTINMFLDMVDPDRAKAISTLPDELTGTPTYLVTIATTVTETKYRFYFNENENTNYFTTETGKAYQVSAADADIFLDSKYAASVFPGSKVPTLILSEEHPVKPSAANWNYSDREGKFHAVDTAPIVGTATDSFEIENGFTLNFSVKPDYLVVKVADASSGHIYFEGSYDDIDDLKIKSSASVVVDISAKWYQAEGSTYYGEMAYKFNTDISAPVSFLISTVGVSVEPGEFIGITAVNAAEVSKIGFSSSPAIDATPVFIKNGDNAYAFLPLDVETETGNYILTFSYGGVTEEIKLTVTETQYAKSWPTYTAAIYNTYYTDAVKKAAADELASYLTYRAGSQLWDGMFAPGIETEYVYWSSYKAADFGKYMYILKDGVETGEMYRNENIDYAAIDGTEVTAVNAGEVVYAGFVDYWGYTVIVEHGYGLKSWYTNMGSISVATGDTVSKGNKVGEVGKTGFTWNNGVQIGLSVFDKFVSPYDIQAYGFAFATEVPEN